MVFSCIDSGCVPGCHLLALRTVQSSIGRRFSSPSWDIVSVPMRLHDEIKRYANLVGYAPTQIKDQNCSCGEELFSVVSDEDEGGAYLNCKNCDSEVDVLASKRYIGEPVQNICNCGEKHMKVAVGYALYPDSTDVRWVYLGCECTKCNLVGVYADWQER